MLSTTSDPQRLGRLRVHPDDRSRGWRRLDLGGASVLHSDTESRWLASDDTQVSFKADEYQRPAEAADLGGEILESRLGELKIRDDEKVSVAGIEEEPRTVRVRKATYYDQHLTNELGLNSYRASDGRVYDASENWVNGHEQVLPLGRTRAADPLGGGVFVVTADDWLVLTRRPMDVAVGQGVLDLSSSGSFDYETATDAESFADMARRELGRELAEELGVRVGVELHLVAFYRHLERGGKPEWLTAARIDLPAGELTAGDDVKTLVPVGQVGRLDDLARVLAEVVDHQSMPGLQLLRWLTHPDTEAPFAKSQIGLLF